MSESIRDIFKSYPPALQPLNEPVDLRNAGGLSGSRFWRYRSAIGDLVLKRWPKLGPNRAEILEKHRWLAFADSLPFVARPFASLDGNSCVEHLAARWEIDPWMAGRPPEKSPPDRNQIEAAFLALARFHLVLSSMSLNAVSPGLNSRLLEIKCWEDNDFDRLFHHLDQAVENEFVKLAMQWVKLARERSREVRLLLERYAPMPRRIQPCLKDARCEHWLFEGARLEGLIDFGAMGMETVAADLARLGSDWFGRDRDLWTFATDCYSSVRRLDHSELGLIDIFVASADLLMGGRWIRWVVLEGRVFEDAGAPLRGLTLGVERLARPETRHFDPGLH